jgi:mRNA interferase HigB
MRLITARTVSAYAAAHAEVRQDLADWVAVVRAARWTSAADLQRSVSGARPISDKRVVFKIHGNKYRIICDLRYANADYNGIVRVQFIGTHAEYNKVDAHTVTLSASSS